MNKPVIADNKPAVLDLKAGTYYWCTCGKSGNKAFCDGSHQGTNFTPLKVTLETDQKVALCLCKQTGNSPFCDGTHSRLDQ
jgi:CDGSH-type Zn-finger protein